MIKSMTGYGRARQELHKRDITVEVRSVNNRYLDCTVKMPRMYAFAEDAVKKHVQQAVSRGKVDVFITVDATAADVAKVAVNRELAAQYAAALGELADVCGTAAYRQLTPETLARFPDVLTVTKADEDLETVSADLCAVLGRGAGRVQCHAGRGGEEAGGGHRRPAGRHRGATPAQVEAAVAGDGGGVPRTSSPPGWRRCCRAPPSTSSGS